MSSRAIAVTILDTLSKRQSNLNYQLQNVQDHKEISFIRALCYGCCRWYTKFEYILDSLLDKKIKTKDSDIKQLLLLGLYEIECMQTPEHASVSETVAVCEELNKQWAKGFVNAILRNYLRKRNTFTINNQYTYSHPAWYLELIKKDWPNNWEAILAANNQQAPMTLRVNLLFNTREEYISLLKENKIDASICKYSESGINLSAPIDINMLPGFEKGLVSVQDEAAQLAAKILVTQANSQVLDACAAPGGKTAHLYEKNKHIKLLAIEKENKRLMLLSNNLNRLNINIESKLADAAKPDEWNTTAIKFDHILLDAPCSASGVIRRHPDIKLHRTIDDVKNMVKTQTQLLASLWSTLKPTGTLLYATCSIFNIENRDQIKAFLMNNSDAELLEANLEEAINTGFGYQILPDNTVDMDGFFYALLKKTN